MIKEAVILAGGFGTRLRQVVSDVPKPMAPINNRPFLEYVFNYLKRYSVQRVVLSVGFMSDIISDHFGGSFNDIEIAYAHEEEPLGTGGAVRHALSFCNEDDVLVLNGDTFFDANLHELSEFHASHNSDITLCLRWLDNVDRYGTVILDKDNRITGFAEKSSVTGEGSINGGIYIIRRSVFNSLPLPEKFSIEKDLFEKYCGELKMFGYTSNGYFIDIGIPQDYSRALHELDHYTDPLCFDKTWTLFLDRDGVINRKRDNDYVKSWDEFEFLPGALEALALFAKTFGHIFIVTNQQGIGKGIFTEQDLSTVHSKMMEQVIAAGGRIDKIYFCPDLAKNDPPCRKPNPGMALQAQQEFPRVDFSRSVMIGDSMTDMEMGKKVGMHTVFISSEKSSSPLIDQQFEGLKDFSRFLVSSF